jgi:hypothetical protein
VPWVDLAGYIASSLVFMTFYMRDMIRLRLVALCSNVVFLIYAGGLHLLPIVILHGALIPVNVCRLVAACRGDSVNLSVATPGHAPRRRRI